MPINPESLYLQLKKLVAEAPIFNSGPIGPEAHQWLGRASLLVEAANGPGSLDAIKFRSAADYLHSTGHPHQITTILHRALAIAEAAAPAATRGGFIAKGAGFDALQVIGQVLAHATRDAFIVDPYMDRCVFTDFATLAAEGVSIKPMFDREYTNPDLITPSLSRWISQYKDSRPIEVRQTRRKALHDRDIIIDGDQVWNLTQSLKNFAGRSFAGVSRVDDEHAAMKREAYMQVWNESEPI